MLNWALGIGGVAFPPSSPTLSEVRLERGMVCLANANDFPLLQLALRLLQAMEESEVQASPKEALKNIRCNLYELGEF